MGVILNICNIFNIIFQRTFLTEAVCDQYSALFIGIKPVLPLDHLSVHACVGDVGERLVIGE